LTSSTIQKQLLEILATNLFLIIDNLRLTAATTVYTSVDNVRTCENRGHH